jgi:hypothetical protein
MKEQGKGGMTPSDIHWDLIDRHKFKMSTHPKIEFVKFAQVG